jgi:hypothetical protein
MHWMTRWSGGWFLKKADAQQKPGQMRDEQTLISVHEGVLNAEISYRRSDSKLPVPSFQASSALAIDSHSGLFRPASPARSQHPCG